MLVCEPRKLQSNVDRMAYDHLVAAGVIFPKGPGRPKATKPARIPRGRIGWKKFSPTGWQKGLCDQCGKVAGIVTPGNPYSMALCPKCEKVHQDAINRGMKPSEDVNW